MRAGSGQSGGERDGQQLLRRIQRLLQHAGEGLLRHRLLVTGNRQPALGDVKRALGGAPVAGRVVQHALLDAVAGDDVGVKLVLPMGSDSSRATP